MLPRTRSSSPNMLPGSRAAAGRYHSLLTGCAARLLILGLATPYTTTSILPPHLHLTCSPRLVLKSSAPPSQRNLPPTTITTTTTTTTATPSAAAATTLYTPPTLLPRRFSLPRLQYILCPLLCSYSSLAPPPRLRLVSLSLSLSLPLSLPLSRPHYTPPATSLTTYHGPSTSIHSTSCERTRYSGNCCWCVQIIPQIWHNWRRKSTEGLPGSMLILWSICGVPFGVYAIVQNFNFALKFQPQAFASLTLIAWGQTLYYHNKWRAWTATVATIALAASFGIMELILILTLRGPYSRGVEWPMMLMAISATIIQVVGLIPPFFELAKRNGRVIGIDFWFLTIDYLGAFFSLMAIVAQQWFDALGASLYIVCMLLETGIFASQAIWLWRVRHVRHEAKKAGKTYDEYIAENPCKKLPHSDSSETFVDVEAGHEKRSPSTCTEAPAASENEHTTTTPTDETRTTQEPSPAPLQAPPPALLQPSGPGIIRF